MWIQAVVEDSTAVLHGQPAVRHRLGVGSGSQPLLKVTKRMKWSNVMELEFAGDAIIEDYASSILTKGSDASLPMDEDGGMKCKEEPRDKSSMAVDFR